MEKNFAAFLKELTPLAFEDFRANYLSKHYDFWEKKNDQGEMIWFCERDFRSQVGYFCDWLDSKSKLLHSPPMGSNLITTQFLIFSAFCQLEQTYK